MHKLAAISITRRRDSLHHKKEELKLIFSQEGPSGADRVRVNDLMVFVCV